MGVNVRVTDDNGLMNGQQSDCARSITSNRVELKRNMKTLNCVSLLIAIIIGSGIFISPKGVVEDTGSVGFALIIWVACGVVSIFGAFAYAELGCMIPRAGGEYEYIMAAFGNVWAFLFIWSFVVIIMPASLAFTALIFADYALQPFYIGCTPPSSARLCIAASITLIITFVNCVSPKWVQIVSHFANVGKVVGLLAIIVFGVYGLIKGNTKNLQDPFENTTQNLLDGVNAFYAGLFSYSGWNYLNYVVEEVVNPNKTVPRSIGIGLSLVIFIYLLANVSYFVLLTPREMIASNAVAFTFVEKFDHRISWTISIFICLSCLGYLNGGFLSASRTILGAARKKHMPMFLSLVNIKFTTPMTSVIFLSLLSLGCLVVDNATLLLKFTVLTEYIFITITVIGLIWLRKKHPHADRPIKVNLFFPYAFLIICVLVIMITCIKTPEDSQICILIILLGLPVYFLFISLEKPVKFQRKIENFSKFLQKITYSVLDESSK